jgi:hypothetical protein
MPLADDSLLGPSRRDSYSFPLWYRSVPGKPLAGIGEHPLNKTQPFSRPIIWYHGSGAGHDSDADGGAVSAGVELAMAAADYGAEACDYGKWVSLNF